HTDARGLRRGRRARGARLAMIAYSFIIESGGRSERMDLECDRLLVGSGAHCDIRLAEEDAAFEHLVISWEGDVMVARVIPDDAISYLDGALFRDAVLSDGSVIALRG